MANTQESAQDDAQELGRVAYKTYRNEVGGTSPHVRASLATWDAQTEELRQAWVVAANAAVALYAHRAGLKP